MITEIAVGTNVSAEPAVAPFAEPRGTPGAVTGGGIDEVLSIVLGVVARGPPSDTDVTPASESVSPIERADPVPVPVVPVATR